MHVEYLCQYYNKLSSTLPHHQTPSAKPQTETTETITYMESETEIAQFTRLTFDLCFDSSDYAHRAAPTHTHIHAVIDTSSP